jgi:hypothetical protein
MGWINKLRENLRARKQTREQRRLENLNAQRRGEIVDDRSRKGEARDSQDFPGADNVGAGWTNPPPP